MRPQNLLACVCLLTPVAHASGSPPNVVLIISDDQAWNDYGFMGHPHVRTPHLDRLAAQSLVYTRGYDTSSVCCTSLASMITGLYPHQAKDLAYRKNRERMVKHITEVPTVPRLLAERGYVSFQTGKWWQGHYRTGGF